MNCLLPKPLNFFFAEATWNWVFWLFIGKAYRLIQKPNYNMSAYIQINILLLGKMKTERQKVMIEF